VLSTLHTNDAAGVIERLADMGIEPYLAASALNGIISQRLVRRICPDCARPAVLSAEEKALLGVKKAMQVYKGTGCAACHQSGYKGRFAVYEYVILDAASRREMADDPIAFARKLRERRSLRKNALEALTDGRTTAEEIIKALHRDG
jgi:type II secretory ATPase GspE/PulE/Tfp pilus assembly ATPase PilB-like protein